MGYVVKSVTYLAPDAFSNTTILLYGTLAPTSEKASATIVGVYYDALATTEEASSTLPTSAAVGHLYRIVRLCLSVTYLGSSAFASKYPNPKYTV
eukprot:gene24340-31672_t